MSDKSLSIVVIGLGGVGNIIANSLFAFTRGLISGWRLKRLMFVDGDTYARSNIPRQMAAGSMLGHNKAEAWANIYAHSKWNFMDTYVEYKPEWITNDSVSRIFENYTGDSESCVIMTCVDNHPARLVVSRWLQDTIKTKYRSVVVIQGGSQPDYATADLHGMWFDDNAGVDLVVGQPIEQGHPEILEGKEGDRSAMSCEELALSPTGDQSYPDNFMAASMMMSLLFTLLSPKGACTLSKYIGEMSEIEMHYHRIEKRIPEDDIEEVTESVEGQETEKQSC